MSDNADKKNKDLEYDIGDTIDDEETLKQILESETAYLKKNFEEDTQENKPLFNKPVSLKKNSVIFENLEQILLDIQMANNCEDPHDRETKLKGVLLYWLGVVFDDGAKPINDYKTALDTSKAIIELLKKNNELMKKQLDESKAKETEIEKLKTSNEVLRKQARQLLKDSEEL